MVLKCRVGGPETCNPMSGVQEWDDGEVLLPGLRRCYGLADPVWCADLGDVVVLPRWQMGCALVEGL